MKTKSESVRGVLPESKRGRARHSVRAADCQPRHFNHSKLHAALVGGPSLAESPRRARSDAPYLCAQGTFGQQALQIRPAALSRNFCTIALAAVCLAAAIAAPFRANAADDGRQYYELRVYLTKSEEQQKRVNDYWQNAAVPAYNRLGFQPIGVFTEMEDSPTNKVYVLIPSDSFEAFGTVPTKLAADAAYQKAAADFLNAPKTNAAYERFESTLLVAFDGMKRMSLPPADKKPNVFELRNYISSSENKGLNKIKMFESGEITVMKEVGLAPIFYSRMLVGSEMPSLVYMTCGENMDAHKKHWQAFSSSPVWKGLQADPQYKDNVSTIIKVILKRTSASQI